MPRSSPNSFVRTRSRTGSSFVDHGRRRARGLKSHPRASATRPRCGYRAGNVPHHSTRAPINEEHKVIFDTALTHDADLAALLTQHLQTTARHLEAMPEEMPNRRRSTRLQADGPRLAGRDARPMMSRPDQIRPHRQPPCERREARSLRPGRRECRARGIDRRSGCARRPARRRLDEQLACSGCAGEDDARADPGDGGISVMQPSATARIISSRARTSSGSQTQIILPNSMVSSMTASKLGARSVP